MRLVSLLAHSAYILKLKHLLISSVLSQLSFNLLHLLLLTIFPFQLPTFSRLDENIVVKVELPMLSPAEESSAADEPEVKPFFGDGKVKAATKR